VGGNKKMNGLAAAKKEKNRKGWSTLKRRPEVAGAKKRMKQKERKKVTIAVQQTISKSAQGGTGNKKKGSLRSFHLVRKLTMRKKKPQPIFGGLAMSPWFPKAPPKKDSVA